MTDSDKSVNYGLSAEPGPFVQGMQKAADSAKGLQNTVATASDQINAQFKKIGDTVNSLNKYMAGFVAVLAGGGELKKFISDANEWNGSAGKMAAQLGISTEKASVLNVALTRLGLDSDTYVGASQKLSKSIQGNAQAFDVMGVATRDAAGNYRPVIDVMGDVNAKLGAIKNPIEQNIAGQQIYGKGWSEVRGILKLTAEQMAESERRGRELGLIVGPEGAAMSKQYTAQMRDLNLVGKSIEIQFGNQMLPVFTRIGSFMSEEGPAAGAAFARILESVAFAASATWLSLKDMGDGIGAIAAQAAALLNGDIDGFKAIGAARDEEAAKNEASFERMKARFGQPMTPATLPADPNINNGNPNYHFKEKAEKDGPEKSRLPEWEAALAEKRAAIARAGLEEGQMRAMSKAEELKYWQDIAAAAGLNSKEKTQAARKVADVQVALVTDTFEQQVRVLESESALYKNNMEVKLGIERQIQAKFAEGTKGYEEAQKRINEIQRQAAEQRKQVATIEAQEVRDAALSKIAIEEQQAQLERELGMATNAEYLAQQSVFEQRRYEIAQQALNERLNLALDDPDTNVVALQQLHAQLEALEQQHHQRLGQIKASATKDSQAITTSMYGSMQSGFANVISQAMKGGLTLTGIFRGMWQAVTGAVTNALSEMAAKWLIQTIMAKMLGKSQAASQVTGSAGAAGAAAVASTAAIPIIGPMLAPGAGLAASVAAMSFMPLAMASAAGGYDIPAAVNPLVQTHAREMILPAKYADVIRGMSDGAEGGGGQGGTFNVTFAGQAMRDNFFLLHRDDLVKALKSAQRDNAWKP